MQAKCTHCQVDCGQSQPGVGGGKALFFERTPMSWDYYQSDSHRFHVDAGAEGTQKGRCETAGSVPFLGDCELGLCSVSVVLSECDSPRAYTLDTAAPRISCYIYFQSCVLENS